MAPPKQTEYYGEIELAGFTMPANVVLTNGSSSLMLGNHYSNGIGVSGNVDRITYIGGGVMRVRVGEQSVLIFSSGMAGEEMSAAAIARRDEEEKKNATVRR